jgi:hypothetical protein
MAESNEVRQHVLKVHVQRARRKGIRAIRLKVGDIRRELGWQARYRQILTALWTKVFEEEARVRNLDKPGKRPPENSTVILRFAILG